MAIENTTICDECKQGLSEGDEVYCVDCHSRSENEIVELEKKISQLEDEIIALGADLDVARGEG